MRLLIVEYFCAGAGRRRPGASLLAEGRAILEAVLEDFAALPGVRILTLRRPDLPLTLPTPHVARTVGARGFAAAFRAALLGVEAALVVAPEKDGALLRLSRAVERAGALNLGCSSSAVRVASDKWRTHRRLERAGVPQPRSALVALRAREVPRRMPAANRRMAPAGWIVKPLDGCGCLGLRAFRRAEELGESLREVRAHTRRAHAILQERRRGVDASVSLLGDGRRAVALSLNGQRLLKRETFTYLGGLTPLSHPGQAQAFEVARRVAAAIPGLRGYFGVDLILERGGARVVDVNPRLTTSYLGLRRVAEANPAAWILDAARAGELPRRPHLRGRVDFSTACATSSAGTSAASI